MIGTLIRKEKSAASSRSMPAKTHAASVVPLLESPGRTASACAPPIRKERFASRRRSGYPRLSRRDASKSRTAVSAKNSQRYFPPKKILSTRSPSRTPTSAAGRVASSRYSNFFLSSLNSAAILEK